MRKTNKVITIVLAIAAALAWFPTASYPFFDLPRWPEMQNTLALTLSAAACFGWLLLFLSERRGDNETRCRKCSYILRGLSEPRCPECGERI